MRRYGESKAHDKQKERIAEILRGYGWEASTEYPFEIPGHKYPYWADVYAQNFCEVRSLRHKEQGVYWSDIHAQSFTVPHWAAVRNRLLQHDSLSKGARRIVLEIQGPKGHNSKLAKTNDDLRIIEIRKEHGEDIEYREVYLKTKKSPNDIRNWSDEDISKELRL